MHMQHLNVAVAASPTPYEVYINMPVTLASAKRSAGATSPAALLVGWGSVTLLGRGWGRQTLHTRLPSYYNLIEAHA